MDDIKEKVRLVYQELQGYLSQTPIPKDANEPVYEEDSWNQVNNCIDELNKISGKDYRRFKIIPENAYGGGYFLRVYLLRQKLGGIIDRLHAEYFSGEERPFSGKPSTVISQSQSQEQNVNLTMILQIQERILEKLNNPNTTAEEKSFLNRVKNGLSGVKSVLELVNLILATAGSIGLSVSTLIKLFGK